MLELVRFIHCNPGRLKVPLDPWLYQWSGYQRSIEEGMKQGHDEKYYQTLDQRFLGKDSLVQEVAQSTEAKEIEIKGKRATFARLLEAICALLEVDSRASLHFGRFLRGRYRRFRDELR